MFSLIASILVFPAQAQLKSQFEIFGSSTYEQNVSNSPLNTGNRVFSLPTWQHTFEFRPDLQYVFSDTQSLVFRSRHFLQSTQTDFSQPAATENKNQVRSDISDAYWTASLSDKTSATLGLQNYQWGPGELLSPSNPLFHFNTEQKSFFYKEKGQVLIRTNWNPTQDWSILTLLEPTDNRDPYWIADSTSSPQGLLKIEKQFENPVNSLAVVAGKIEEKTAFFGEHGNWSPAEGYSIYLDVRHQQGDFHYKHYTDGSGFIYLDKKNDNLSQILTLALAGFRWEGRTDFRQELIWNEAGYNKNEWAAVLQSVTTASPYLAQNLRRFSQPGLELRTKLYSYTSLRVPNLGSNNQISVSIRCLASLSEDSSIWQFNYEHDLSDAMVASAEVIVIGGRNNTEFRLLKEGQASLGFRWSF
jgi:hypothetical protein